MMAGLAVRFWSMSLQACVLILVVLAVRLCLKRYPKVYSYCLWGLVGLRLLCPVFVETPFSLQPESIAWEGSHAGPGLDVQEYNGGGTTGRGQESYWVEAPAAGLDTGTPDMPSQPGTPGGDFAGESPVEEKAGDAGQDGAPGGSILKIGSTGMAELIRSVWDSPEKAGLLTGIYLVGVGAVLCFYLIQYGMVRRRTATAVRGEGNLWHSGNIVSPFVMGVLRPRIILPYGLDDGAIYHILKHERMHIRHHDPLVRLLGALCVCLHWWNPLVWLAVHVMDQDMEMFCDESVLRNSPIEERKAYARTLLSFAERQNRLSIGLAFGESNTERRVRNLSGKRRGGLLVVGLVALVAVFCSVTLLTIPSRGQHTDGTDVGGAAGNVGGKKQEPVLTEDDLAWLEGSLFRIPDFTCQKDIGTQFWEEYLFCSYTSDYEWESVRRMSDAPEDGVTYAKVPYDEVEHRVEALFGKPFSEYVKEPRILGAEDSPFHENVFYEDGYFYISNSDSPEFEYQFEGTTVYDGMTELTWLKRVAWDEEDSGSQVHLYLLPADNERGFVVDGKETILIPTPAPEEGMIEGGSYGVEMNPYGWVTFAVFGPDTSLSPYADVRFMLLQEGKVLQEFPQADTDGRGNGWIFQSVEAVAFPDINNDGYTDIITIVNYLTDGGMPVSEARIFTGRENRIFLEETYLGEIYNQGHDVKGIEDIEVFVTQPANRDYFVRTSIYGYWSVKKHIPPMGIYALSEEEIQSFEDTYLHYEKDWYSQSAQNVHQTVDSYVGTDLTLQEFGEEAGINTSDLGTGTDMVRYYSLEGVEDSLPSFGQHFYLLDDDNALIYYEGVLFRAERQ